MLHPHMLKATPSRDGNGFSAGKVYTFKPTPDCWGYNEGKPSLYTAQNDRGHERHESYDTLTEAKPSAHLWDGLNWKAAGHWTIAE